MLCLDVRVIDTLSVEALTETNDPTGLCKIFCQNYKAKL